jgi:hypothetical protein
MSLPIGGVYNHRLKWLKIEPLTVLLLSGGTDENPPECFPEGFDLLALPLIFKQSKINHQLF